SAAWLAGYGSFGMSGRYPMGVIAVTVPPEDVDVNVHPTKIEVRFAHPQAVFDAVRRAVARTLRKTEPVRELAVASSQRAFAAVRDGADVETADLEQISFAPRPPLLSSPPRILGQIDRTYIVAASEGELYVVDQHAAHERIAFEAIVESAGARDSSAPLPLPA